MTVLAILIGVPGLVVVGRAVLDVRRTRRPAP
jgi:hypothetical protein